MTVIKNLKNNKSIVTVVCCLHGDEIFGLRVFEYFQKCIQDFSGLKIILANEPALRAKKRFITHDLNRVFPGQSRGSYEQVLAQRIMKEIGQTKYLLDIHTTTADIEMTPIVTNLNHNTKKVINLCNSKEVAKMKKTFGTKALIGQFNSGVSFEFNEQYAKQELALRGVINMVQALLSGRIVQKKPRKIFYINSIISLDESFSRAARNFIRCKNIYPFLLGNKSYKDIKGFAANKYVRKQI
ncbi:hypothetical protein HOB10_05530 [Candidatus Parcubacteria bacterium]|jgi:succinylglutamate desuccinylase|nr:hypothetical protein [Candidatus Parcubacteria bacterium]